MKVITRKLTWTKVDRHEFRETVAAFYESEFGRTLGNPSEHHPWNHFLLWELKGDKRILVGWHLGRALSLDRYYLANTCILPAYRNQGIYQEAMPRLFQVLRALSFSSVISRHRADRPAILHLKKKQGFTRIQAAQSTRQGVLTEWHLDL